MNLNGECALTAEKLFKKGYNCAQAMILTFADTMSMDLEAALQMASPFGGGMGRMRSVCGTVTGAYMVLGQVLGYHNPKDAAKKTRLYEYVQEFARRFTQDNGSILCADLLDERAKGEAGATPSPRTKAYYAARPCAKLAAYSAALLEEMLIQIQESNVSSAITE